MRDSKRWSVWPAITLFLGVLFGTGGLWQFQKNRLDRERFEFEKVTRAVEIRKHLDELYQSILQLSDEYIRTSASYHASQNPTDAEKMRHLIARLNVLKSDYTTTEGTLSSIEGRTPRQIRIDFIAPSPPTSLRVMQ